ncbi:MAG: peptidoglycan editing factor PgeF, partial [Gammaproteobacteria bacterium]
MNESQDCGNFSPDWPAPACVRAFCTTRQGGFSEAPWDSFNLADHVGDNRESVQLNRELLKKCLSLPAEPLWLTQVHGCEVASFDEKSTKVECDASVSFIPSQVCAVLTADCLPLLLCSKEGDRIAAVHAGWRGLAAGVIEKTIGRLTLEPHSLMAWLGPAIGQDRFEVGNEVRDIFMANNTGAEKAFIRNKNNRWLCDLYQLAKQRLKFLGVDAIYGGD